MSRICSICARGGSKGVKNKNVRDLLGLPLIAHSILQAQRSGLFEQIAVSSDSSEILAVAAEYHVDHLVERPESMATDTAPKLPVIQHCIREAERRTNRRFSVIVDLDATSPLRINEDIVGVVALLESTGASNVITGALARRSPYFNLVELDSSGIVGLSKKLPQAVVRRQDSPKCYDMNASIYAWTHEGLMSSETVFNHDTRLFVMPEERSIDIDSELDFEFVEFLMRKRSGSHGF